MAEHTHTHTAATSQDGYSPYGDPWTVHTCACGAWTHTKRGEDPTTQPQFLWSPAETRLAMRHTHDPQPLYQRPAREDGGARLTYLLRHLGCYVRCSGCGRVGMTAPRHPSHRFHWLHPDMAEEEVRAAEAWTRTLTERTQQPRGPA